MMLYFGARYRASEYLYGEELDGYHADGVITDLRLAFSRDQQEKVYIQHLLREDRERLAQYLSRDGGHFYLCGPTWPVPDVRDAVVDGLVSDGMSEAEAAAFIEELKEKERYTLEVY